MSSLQLQARALGDPTRHAVFRFVVDADHQVGVAELTEHLGLNHNAIRQHLAKLVEAGLLRETTATPQGRGRPRLLYEPDPSVDSRWGVAGPCERLSIMLTEMIASGESPEVVGHRTGQRLVASGAGSHGEPLDGIAELVAQMDRQGFEPSVEETGDGVDVVLGTCPFAAAADTDADTICGLHLGMARGIADATGDVIVDGLVRNDPHRAQCRLRCHRVEVAVPLAAGRR